MFQSYVVYEEYKVLDVYKIVGEKLSCKRDTRGCTSGLGHTTKIVSVVTVQTDLGDRHHATGASGQSSDVDDVYATQVVRGLDLTATVRPTRGREA